VTARSDEVDDGTDAVGDALLCPVTSSLLLARPGEPIVLWEDARAVLACDPGVQSGWVLAVSTRGVIVPIASMLIGTRSRPGRRGVPMVRAHAPVCNDHERAIRRLLDVYEGATTLPDDTSWCRPLPVVVCEDWFAGVNPGTARDIARQFYFAEAAAQRHGLVFRAVANQTWKKTYLGRGNMRSDEALLAYSAAGYAAHPHVGRWAGTTVGALTQTDDAAALGIATWYLKTEAT